MRLPDEVLVVGYVVDKFDVIGVECSDDCPIAVDLAFCLLEGFEWSVVGCHREELSSIPSKDVGKDSFCPEVVKGSPTEPPGVKELVGGPELVFIRVWSSSSRVPASVNTASNRLTRSAKRESVKRVMVGRVVV